VHACYAAVRNATSNLTNLLGLGRTAGRFGVLRALWLSPDSKMSQKEIGTKLMVTWATVTVLVDGLEKDGLVTRATSERDRRSTIVALTPSGREACTRIVPAMAKLSALVCDDFTDEEKQTLTSLLLRMWRNARAFDPEKDLDGSIELATGGKSAKNSGKK
jgi:DNA-binding MarR family transcriptional regulator